MKPAAKTATKKNRRKTRRNAAWLAMSAMSTVVVCGTTTAEPLGRAAASTLSVPQTAARVYEFDISPGLLDEVIEAFKRTAGVDVMFSRAGIGTLPSPGIRGNYSADQALRIILAGTGATFRYSASNTISIDLSTLSESVDVMAIAPAVVTSSPKFTEPLRDIPQTITVIPQSVIQQQGATTLREVLRNVTGISIQAGEGGVPAGDNLSIRGFNARTDMFVDGVRDFGAYSRDPFNIEQVEVSKGPSSAYVGRGSTGGSINLSTKTPGLLPLRSITLAGGSGNYKRATIDLNQPIDALGGAAFRLNAMFTDADTPGRAQVENSRTGVAPSLAFGLNGMTRAIFSYTHLDQDNLPDYGIPWVPNTNTALAAYSDKAPPVSFRNFYGLTTRDFEKTFTRIGSGEVRHYFNNSITLRSIVRHGRTKRDSVITAPRFATTTGTAINRQLQSRDQTDVITASQTNLNAIANTGKVEHALIAGIEFGRETSQNFARTGPAAPTTDLFDPDSNQPYAGPITRTGAVTKAIADTVAAYVGDTAKIGEHWQLTGSLRFDDFKLDYKSTAITGVVSPFERTDRMVSGRAGVVFKPVTEGSVYFGYGTSLNPSAEGFSLSASTTDLKPEKSQSYETGVKWDVYANRLALNAAYFRTEKTNARTPGINPGDPPTVLDGQQNVDGLEFGLTGNVTLRWQTIGSYTFMRSEIRQSNTAIEVGREFSNTPRHSFNLWTNYRFPWRFDLGGGVNYVGDRTNSTTTVRTAPGYWLADLTAAYHVNERFTLRFNVSNLTDTQYIDRVGGGHFVPGPGRMAMLTTDFRF
jgi:catecholate siderophore receptor